MKTCILSTATLLFVALAPAAALADVLGLSDVTMTALASFTTQTQPDRIAAENDSGVFGSAANVNVLVLAEGVNAIPFPNLPTSQTRAFASSATVANGLFGVGVSGFFFASALPPNALVAEGSTSQTITNTSTTDTVPVLLDFFIPSPTLRFFNVGNSFPAGADPDRDASATARLSLLTKLTRADGTVVEEVPLDYGVRTFREPVTGVFLALPIGSGNLERFDEFDGSFGFSRPDLTGNGFNIGNLGPGETLEVTYDYFAQVSTGFGETGVFAAIGDPFNLETGGGRFSLQIGDPQQPPVVPEPAAAALVALGVLATVFRTRRLATRDR
jgi:hypothetical protein